MSYYFNNSANILTILRIFLSPIFFFFFVFKFYVFSFICFLIASITDVLDGYLARKYNIASDFGKFYDPLADKILIFFSFLCILIFPPFIFSNPPGDEWRIILLYFPLSLILIRDFLITFLRNKLKEKGIILKSNFLGKSKTVFQLIFIAIYLLEFLLMSINFGQTNFNFGIVKIDIAIPIFFGFAFLFFEFSTVLLSIISGLNYFLKNRKKIFE